MNTIIFLFLHFAKLCKGTLQIELMWSQKYNVCEDMMQYQWKDKIAAHLTS